MFMINKKKPKKKEWRLDPIFFLLYWVKICFLIIILNNVNPSSKIMSISLWITARLLILILILILIQKLCSGIFCIYVISLCILCFIIINVFITLRTFILNILIFNYCFLYEYITIYIYKNLISGNYAWNYKKNVLFWSKILLKYYNSIYTYRIAIRKNLLEALDLY